MASFHTTYLRDKLNDHVRGGPDYTRPGTLYYSLMTAAPTIAGGGTESALSRLAVTNNSTNFPASSSGIKRNGTVFTFTSSSPSALGSIVGIAEFDASSGGNMLSYGDLDTPRTVALGAAFAVEVNGGEFTFSETA